MQDASMSAGFAGRMVRLFWLSLLVAHALAAAAWFCLEPKGYPWSDARFWVNGPLPLLALAWCLACLAALRRDDAARLKDLLPSYPAAWAAGAVAARFAFPITCASLAPADGSGPGHGRLLVTHSAPWLEAARKEHG